MPTTCHVRSIELRKPVLQSRLLDIAVREFGSKGLDGASTRSIAAAAGTAMSSITYHYGGKEGLYLAAADHIASEMAAMMSPVLDDTAASDAGSARASIHAILAAFADKMVGSDETSEWSLFIMREQMRPTEAFERLYAGPMGQMAERLVADVLTATGASDDDARATAVMLFGQVLVWRASRALAGRVMARSIDADTASAIRARLSAQTDCILDSLSHQQEPR
jgi:AcrR family transcriptional regulator